jgi:autotransporter-associated beta strand protein
VDSGVELERTGGAVVIPGDLTITPNGAVNEFSSNEIAATSNVINNGQFGIAAIGTPLTQTFATLNGNGSINAFGNQPSILTIGSGTFTGAITDGGNANALGITKQGNGTLLLSGNSTYLGPTSLTGGILQAGSSTALGRGAFTSTAGTLELANANRSLSLGTTYTQGAAAGLTLRVDPSTADQVNAGGNASLAGNLTLNFSGFSASAGTPAATRMYTLLTSTGLNGSMFTTVTENGTPAGSTEMVTYTPDDVLLNVQTLAVLFPTTGGLTPNQEAVLAPINNGLTAGNMTANFTAFDTALANLFATNPGAFGSALDELSPQAFGQFTSKTAFDNASFESQAMDEYLAGQRSGANGTFVGGNGGIDASGLSVNDPDYDSALAVVHSRLMAWNPAPFDGAISDVVQPMLGGMDLRDNKDMKDTKSVAGPVYTDPWNFFVRGNVILAQGFSNSDVSHFDDNTESVVLGTDYRITRSLLVGLTAGYGHTDVTLDDNGSSATVDSYSPGLYAAYADKGWFSNLSGNYVHNAYTQERHIAFLGQTANSAPEGNQGTANLDGGYEFHQGALTFGPAAGIQYTYLTVDGYHESGSVADLNVYDQDSDSLRSRLGGRLCYTFAGAGIHFSPHLAASWQHEFMDQSRGITSQFDNAGLGSFAVRTENPSRDSALIDAGVSAEFNRTVTVFADYVAQAGQDNYFGQSVQAGVKIGF